MLIRLWVAAGLVCIAMACHGQNAATFDAASAFGARPSVDDLRISPDGSSVAYISPAKGQGSVAYTLSLAKGSTPKAILLADGNPFHLADCHWVSNDRLVCLLRGIEQLSPKVGGGRAANISRTFAVDADGKNLKMLSTRQNEYTQGYILGGGNVIDWLPDENGAVLMTRVYLPDEHIGSHTGSADRGLGVDQIDTRNLSIQRVEPPVPEAVRYISDGRGTVRIMGLKEKSAGKDSGTIKYLYRLVGSRDWRPLSQFDTVDGSGFLPQAIDHDRNIAYGYKKKDGHTALYSVTLDETLHEEIVYERTDADVRGLIYLGRDNRVVGAHYAADVGGAYYFSPDVKSMIASLGKALPNRRIDVVDSTLDRNRMLVRTSSDTDAGVYYIFDTKAHQLQTFLAVRSELEGVTLAHVQSITYSASDGTPIQAYLTLPPGKEDARGLPAIVLPHSGPASRDEWGFGWLSQFLAARGFAVLQPNFRGAGGSGDSWFEKNGFKSWPIAVGDVSDGGRWLIQGGIADPAKLAIVGWSNGGYAALLSAAVNPDLFKAVVAIAPVSDLAALKEEHRHWSDFRLVSDFVGEGPHMREGSPIEQAAKIKAPVLLFHGALDADVDIQESKSMAARLNAVGGKCELVTFDKLDHQLEDSDARAQMLHKSDEFLRKALGM